MLGLRKLAALWRVKQHAEQMYDLAQDAEADPRLYRDPAWWERVLTAAAALLRNIPLAPTGRQTMNAWMQKIGIIAGVTVAVAGALRTAPIPAQYQGIAELIGSFAAMVAGLYHPVPGATDQPAK